MGLLVTAPSVHRTCSNRQRRLSRAIDDAGLEMFRRLDCRDATCTLLRNRYHPDCCTRTLFSDISTAFPLFGCHALDLHPGQRSICPISWWEDLYLAWLYPSFRSSSSVSDSPFAVPKRSRTFNTARHPLSLAQAERKHRFCVLLIQTAKESRADQDIRHYLSDSSIDVGPLGRI